jgi:hypothetical protein
VGGVAGGKHLIQAARTQSVVKDAQSFKTAWSIFEDQYDAVPGDMIEAYDYWPGETGCSTEALCNGGGDRLINHYTKWFMVCPHLNHADIYPNSLNGARNTKNCISAACGYNEG